MLLVSVLDTDSVSLSLLELKLGFLLGKGGLVTSALGLSSDVVMMTTSVVGRAGDLSESPKYGHVHGGGSKDRGSCVLSVLLLLGRLAASRLALVSNNV